MRITIIQHSFIIIVSIIIVSIHKTPTTINPLYNYRFSSDTFYADDTVVLLSRFAGVLHRNKANVLYICSCTGRLVLAVAKISSKTKRIGGKSDWVGWLKTYIGLGDTTRIR